MLHASKPWPAGKNVVVFSAAGWYNFGIPEKTVISAGRTGGRRENVSCKR